MSDKKHTPGPWEVEIDGDLAISVQPIATVVSVYDGSETNEKKQIDLANASLIAAAPELLGAVDWIARTVHQAHHDGEIETCQKNTCCHARTVIAKAEGK